MLDPALRRVVEAESEEEAQRELESLIEHRVGPLVRKIVAQKLRAFGSSKGSEPEDLEDAVGDALLMFVKRMQPLRDPPTSHVIESLDDYIAALAYNVCAHHLRRRYPERSGLKNRLRYLLGQGGRFALWDTSTAGLHCGLSRWRGAEPDSAASDRFSALEREPERWPRSWQPAPAHRADPAPIVSDILTRIDGPIDFDRLVGLVASVWQIDRARTADSSCLHDVTSDRGVSPEIAIDQRRFAERLWAEVQELPVRQRVALLLNLRDGRGAGVLWVLPVTGVASMRSIARALELPLEELAAMWGTLPIDDNMIADRLGCTRQQVINLRMSARKRLANRLSALDPRQEETVRPSANLRRLSASMGNDT